MQQKNVVIVCSIIGGAFLIILILANIGPALKGGAIVDKGQRFTAKPGTTRENAMILTSARRPEGEEPDAAIARRTEELEETGSLEMKSLSKKDPDVRSGPANDLAQAALNSFSPEAGLRQIDEALKTPHSAGQAALLYEARGQLCAQLDPPDYEGARQAFETALEKADDPDLKEEIAYTAVQMLVQAGQVDEAEAKIEDHLAAKPPTGATGFKLQLLQGQLQERAGAIDKAEQIYHAVLETVESLPESMPREEALALARLAGLRLAQLYRSHNRGDAADVFSADLKKQLTRMENARRPEEATQPQ